MEITEEDSLVVVALMEVKMLVEDIVERVVDKEIVIVEVDGVEIMGEGLEELEA